MEKRPNNKNIESLDFTRKVFFFKALTLKYQLQSAGTDSEFFSEEIKWEKDEEQK